MSEINVVINGKEKVIDSDSTIKKLLRELEIKGPMIVVEKNLEIVSKERYSDFIREGDRLEIVGFFGGG